MESVRALCRDVSTFSSIVYMYTYVVPSLNLRSGESASSYNDSLARWFVHASDVHILVSHRVGQHGTVLRRRILDCVHAAKGLLQLDGAFIFLALFISEMLPEI